MTLQIGDKAPDFTLPVDDNTSLTLSDYRGERVILYFYPKDDTPGCTTEACDFNNHLPQFNDQDVNIFGISKDSIAKHAKFKAKHSLGFPLASDENSDVCERYGVWKEKSMYGKSYMGIERTTFLIDENGVISHIWPKVKVKGHVEDVMSVIHK
jgi:peroxiredoxin Q/BCP